MSTLIHEQPIRSYKDILSIMDTVTKFNMKTPLARYIASKGKNNVDDTKRLFDVMFDRAKYVPVSQTQDMQTINKLWRDEKANCVDYSMALSSILTLRGVPNGFVACGYDQDHVTHVYVLAYPDGDKGRIEKVVLDCVLEQDIEGYGDKSRPHNIKGAFNKEVNTPFKKYYPILKIDDYESKSLERLQS